MRLHGFMAQEVALALSERLSGTRQQDSKFKLGLVVEGGGIRGVASLAALAAIECDRRNEKGPFLPI